MKKIIISIIMYLFIVSISYSEKITIISSNNEELERNMPLHILEAQHLIRGLVEQINKKNKYISELNTEYKELKDNIIKQIDSNNLLLEDSYKKNKKLIKSIKNNKFLGIGIGYNKILNEGEIYDLVFSIELFHIIQIQPSIGLFVNRKINSINYYPVVGLNLLYMFY